MISQSKSKEEAILSAALQLFVDQGFHGTPTGAIAKAAGVANGTLFHYFPTKDELIQAIYIDVKSRLTDFMMSRSGQGKDLKTQMQTYYINSLQWGLGHSLELRYMQQFLSSPYILQVDPEKIREQKGAMIDMIQKGIDMKLIKPMSLELIFTLLSSHVFGMNQYLHANTFSEQEKEKIMSESFDAIWDMIAVR